MGRWRKPKLKLNTKWFSTVASIWIQCTSGSMYTFSIYSSTLKSTQGYDQSTLDVVSVFKDIGANTGLLSGLLYTYVTYSTTSRNRVVGGPWVVHLVGLVQSFLGYFMMWAAVSGVIPRPPVALMCLFMLVAAHGQTFFNTTDVVTSVRNFTGYSGTVVGIMKGYLGLSGAILVQVYDTIFEERPTAYLLMLALLTSINPLLLMWFVRIYNVNKPNEKKYLDYYSAIALTVAAYLILIIVLEQVLGFQLAVRIIAFVLLLALLASPLVVAIRAGAHESDDILDENPAVDESRSLERHESDEYHPLPGNAEDDADAVEKNSLQVVEERNLLQAARSVDFWLLFFAMACGMGSGLATINNVSQVGQSLGYSTLEISTIVSLLSIWNFLGRFGAGYTTDYLLLTRRWARPLFMAITLAGLTIGHVVVASGLPGALYAGSVLVGVFYGSQWSLMPTIASEIFGVRHMGTIFNTITIANPLGSYIFSVRVIGYIYDKEAGEDNTCTGTKCFFLSFMIMASATLMGSFAALWLFFRTRSFYNNVILRRLLHHARY